MASVTLGPWSEGLVGAVGRGQGQDTATGRGSSPGDRDSHPMGVCHRSGMLLLQLLPHRPFCSAFLLLTLGTRGRETEGAMGQQPPPVPPTRGQSWDPLQETEGAHLGDPRQMGG